jgi:hypothetical protein
MSSLNLKHPKALKSPSVVGVKVLWFRRSTKGFANTIVKNGKKGSGTLTLGHGPHRHQRIPTTKTAANGSPARTLPGGSGFTNRRGLLLRPSEQ